MGGISGTRAINAQLRREDMLLVIPSLDAPIAFRLHALLVGVLPGEPAIRCSLATSLPKQVADVLVFDPMTQVVGAEVLMSGTPELEEVLG